LTIAESVGELERGRTTVKHAQPVHTRPARRRRQLNQLQVDRPTADSNYRRAAFGRAGVDVDGDDHLTCSTARML